jgi:hypothetical protein
MAHFVFKWNKEDYLSLGPTVAKDQEKDDQEHHKPRLG